MLLTRHPLGRGPPSPNGPAQHVQTQPPTRPRLIADNRTGYLQLTQTMGPGLPPALQVAGDKTGPQQASRRVRSFDRDRHDNPNSHPRPGTIKAILGITSILVQVRQPSTSHLAKLRLGPRIPGSSNFSPFRCLLQLHPIPTHFIYSSPCRSPTSALPHCSLVLFLNLTCLLA
jgi:hypothetical protein